MGIDGKSDSSEMSEGVIKEIEIKGNNKWFAFFEYDGDSGFFRINQLHVEKTSGFERKIFTDVNDLDDFIMRQGEGCRVWAKIKSHDPDAFDEDIKFLTLVDGTTVYPRWRSDLVWIGSEVEPEHKIPVFHVEHPDTQVVQVHVKGHLGICLFASFKMFGQFIQNIIVSYKIGCCE
jgi:hypothetical protein